MAELIKENAALRADKESLLKINSELKLQVSQLKAEARQRASK